jgi:glycerol kinase
MRILAIDQGTSATKALVEDDDGTILGAAEAPVRPVAGPDGAVEQDPEQLWESVVTAGREAIAAAGVAVDAVGLANQGETVLAWDRATGNPLTVALSWQDRRSAAITERLAPHANELLATTGLPLDPYFAAPKMAYLRDRVTTAGVVTTSDVWLVHRLSGVFVTDVATASRTMLLDLDSACWSTEAAALFRLADEELPALVESSEAVGETALFGAPIPIRGLCVDQQAALYGQGCRRPGETKCTYGTGAFLLANAGATPVRSRNGLSASVAWRLGGTTTYCLDGQVYSAGSAIAWLQCVGILADAEELDRVAGSVADSGGVAFSPALAGLAAPHWRPKAQGAFVGLHLGTSRAHMVRAVVDGLAASVAELVAVAREDLGLEVDRLRVDGGLTRSRTLMQAQADVLQIPVEVFHSPHATAVGIAALARYGADGHDSERRPSASYEPSISAGEAASRLARWRRAVAVSIELDGDAG